MKSVNLFGYPKIPSADSIVTEGLPDGCSPSRRNNPQLEKFRNNIRNSLFSGENTLNLRTTRTQSSPSGDAKSTGDLEATLKRAEQSESISPSHTRLDQVRSSLKGSLFLLSHQNSNISPCHNGSPNSIRSLLQPVEMTNTNPTLEESQEAQGEISPNPLSEGTKEKIEDTISNFDSPESYDEEDSPSDKNDIIVSFPKHSIFLDTVEHEMEDLKKELNIDESSKIYFIQGNFSKYYREGQVLGEGSSGIVKKCVKVGSREEFAIKVIQYKGDREILTMIIQEFENLKKLNHKNVIKVFELYVDYFKKKIYTVMELADCREMFEVLKDLGNYSEAIASGIFKQILTGINYLHLNGVCHRDIKPNNILVSNDGKTVKITDFNVSKFLDKKDPKNKYSSLSAENYKMWTYTGTIAFTAPEVFIDNEYTERVDVWSAGVVLYTMLCGYQPFHAAYVKDLIELIKEGKYSFPPEQWESISEQAKDLIRHCLDVNCKTRYSPADALMHPWIVNQVKVSDRKISFRDNFRVYYKKYTSTQKNYTCAVEMKKVQVTSPHIAVASPAVRLKRRSGTFRVMEQYFKGKSPSKQTIVLKEVNSAGEETISSVLEEPNDESPMLRSNRFEADELEILTALNQDKSWSFEKKEPKKLEEKASKALHERANEPALLALKVQPVLNLEMEKKKATENQDNRQIKENNDDLIVIKPTMIEN